MTCYLPAAVRRVKMKTKIQTGFFFFFFNLVFIDLDFRATAKNSASVENYQTLYQYSIIAHLELQALDKSQREHPI